MSQKLWVEHETPAKTFGPTRVSTKGCDYVDDFLENIKKKFEIPGPSAHLTLYRRDGTKIDVGDSPALLDAGKSRNNALIVKTAAVGSTEVEALTVVNQETSTKFHSGIF